MMEEITFEVMTIEKAADVTRLHIEGIKTGFIQLPGDWSCCGLNTSMMFHTIIKA